MSDPLSLLATALADRYRLERKLGEGGMASVYLAQDLKHDRPVAIKVLRPELAAVIGAERFLAEIRTTANLQHPHILPLFDSGVARVRAHAPGVEDVAGDPRPPTLDPETLTFLYYVMPFVEGESLRDRLQRERQLPVEDAVRLASEIAAALDYAHRHGIIHRDIKPENVMLHDGRALVTDFGIALAVSRTAGTRMTDSGMSLGTPQYMSPEQAMAERDLTPRSDIFSLGCVSYEMLVGEPPFSGATPQAVTARILSETPKSIRQVRDRVSPELEAAIFTAMAKAPADRFASAGAFAQALGASPTRGSAPAMVVHRGGTARRWPWILLGATLAGAAGIVTTWLRPAPTPMVLRYGLSLPPGRQFGLGLGGNNLAVTRDGRWILYTGDRSNLWLLDRTRLDPTPVKGAENAINPVFSPDGQRIAFQDFQSLEIRTLPVGGGQPTRLARPASGGGGLEWSDDGWIYFDSPDGISRVPENGGPATLVVPYDTTVGEVGVAWPQVLPGGRVMLFRSRSNDRPEEFWIIAYDMEKRERRRLITGIQARLLAPDLLLVVRSDGTLVGVRFDAGNLSVRGTPVLLASGVMTKGGGVAWADFAVAPSGVVLYVQGPTSGSQAEVVQVGRDGTVEPLRPGVTVQPGILGSLALSPDGRRLALDMAGPTSSDIWVKELPSGPLTRLTFEGSQNGRAVWEPDGKHLLFISDRGGRPAIWRQRADGSAPAEPVGTGAEGPILEVLRAPNGNLVYRMDSSMASGTMSRDFFLLTSGTSSIPLLASPENERAAALSPDGHWLAYQSDESGQPEVYVRPFPNVRSARWQVTTYGGGVPRWAHSGRELFFESSRNELVSVPVIPGPTFQFGPPERLFGGLGTEFSQGAMPQWDISPDDRHFVMMRTSGWDDLGTRFIVVEHLADEARRLLTAAKP